MHKCEPPLITLRGIGVSGWFGSRLSSSRPPRGSTGAQHEFSTSVPGLSVYQSFVHSHELLTESRRQAMERMLVQAEQLQANAVVNVRFTTSAVTSGAAELYAYGTAVVVEADGQA